MELPIACEACLGGNPNVRMTRQSFGSDCKICLNSFTVFRWSPGVGLKFRRTEICITCARLKNVCQSCLLDLQYGLPVQVRDSVLGIKNSVPKITSNRDYALATNAARMARGDSTLIVDYDRLAADEPEAHAMLAKLTDKRRPKSHKSNAGHMAALQKMGNDKEMLLLAQSDALVDFDPASDSNTDDGHEFEALDTDGALDATIADTSNAKIINDGTINAERNETNGKSINGNEAQAIKDQSLIKDASHVVPLSNSSNQSLLPTRRNNLPPPCTFYAKGLCNRGDACPYRHVLLPVRSSSLKNYRARYHGTGEDESAVQILKAAPHAVNFVLKKAPSDLSIRTLILQGLKSGSIGAADIHRYFSDINGSGQIQSNGNANASSLSSEVKVLMSKDRNAAKVTFATRAAVEAAARKSLGIVEMGEHGVSVHISWAKGSDGLHDKSIKSDAADTGTNIHTTNDVEDRIMEKRPRV